MPKKIHSSESNSNVYVVMTFLPDTNEVIWSIQKSCTINTVGFILELCLIFFRKHTVISLMIITWYNSTWLRNSWFDIRSLGWRSTQQLRRCFYSKRDQLLLSALSGTTATHGQNGPHSLIITATSQPAGPTLAE